MSRSRNLAARTQTGSPHIILEKLYPAYLGKLLDDTTTHSGDYGTVQADGRMYYYTDIAGSKPIKDPRIGAHFGSQRHKFKSYQLLEQETACSGGNVYSLDGREWARIYDEENKLTLYNASSYQGAYFLTGTADKQFIEIVAYANDLNYLALSNTVRNFNVSVNGGTAQLNTGMTATVTSPLGSRYVDGFSVVNCSFNSTPSLGINTFKISNVASHYLYPVGIELIAQDTTSTTTKSQIQIPSQSVYTGNGTHPISAQATHYDPFNGLTSASGFGGYVDEASSLGLDKWKVGATCYRPYNGGRVVKWVDLDGVVKTSVTLMPPNAKSIGDSSSLTNATAKSDASAANNTFYPTFEAHTTSVNEDQFHEVAKTFHWREFGNGSANAGTTAPYADTSMLTTTPDDIAYVMDDGLTSLTGDNVKSNPQGTHDRMIPNADGDPYYITFIGTGVSYNSSASSASDAFNNIAVAQNLPYGTHILKVVREDTGARAILTVDGVTVTSVGDSYYAVLDGYVTFHQPKRPPIPEDACVIADYMLMADFVKQGNTNDSVISKGVRALSGTRDVFYNAGSAFAENSNIEDGYWPFGYEAVASPGSTHTASAKIPFFGTNAISLIQDSAQAAHTIDFAGSTGVARTALNSSTNDKSDGFSIDAGATLGLNEVTTNIKTGGYGWQGYYLATPIHTSSHYQTFETPFLHELVGGDRNMEQNNLIVTPDGKSWDEVTRDVSYIGNEILAVSRHSQMLSGTVHYTEWRGKDVGRHCVQKDIVSSRSDGKWSFTFLKEGTYEITGTLQETGTTWVAFFIYDLNGDKIAYVEDEANGYGSLNISAMNYFQRGEGFRVTIGGAAGGHAWSDPTNQLLIRRV